MYAVFDRGCVHNHDETYINPTQETVSDQIRNSNWSKLIHKVIVPPHLINSNLFPILTTAKE